MTKTLEQLINLRKLYKLIIKTTKIDILFSSNIIKKIILKLIHMKQTSNYS